MSTPQEYLLQQQQKKREEMAKKNRKVVSLNLREHDDLMVVSEEEAELKSLLLQKKFTKSENPPQAKIGEEGSRNIRTAFLKNKFKKFRENSAASVDDPVEVELGDVEEVYGEVRSRFHKSISIFQERERANSMASNSPVGRKTALSPNIPARKPSKKLSDRKPSHPSNLDPNQQPIRRNKKPHVPEKVKVDESIPVPTIKKVSNIVKQAPKIEPSANSVSKPKETETVPPKKFKPAPVKSKNAPVTTQPKIGKYSSFRPKALPTIPKVSSLPLHKPVKEVKPREKQEWEKLEPAVRAAFWSEHTIKSNSYFYAAAVKGWRDSMEDSMDVFWTFDKTTPNLFGVYDGHGGDSCALFCQKYLLKRLALHSGLRTNTKPVIAETFKTLDEAYNKKFPQSTAGATATVLYILPVETKSKTDADVSHIQYRFFCAAVGDSRAVLVYKSGKVAPITFDHNLHREDELERVKKGGGELRYDPRFNELLVYSEKVERGLNVTRTIGDLAFKPLVSASPEVTEGFLTQESNYIVLASDGLWGSVSNEETAKIVTENSPRRAVEILQDLANYRGCYDNTTVMVVDLTKLVQKMEKEVLKHFAS